MAKTKFTIIIPVSVWDDSRNTFAFGTVDLRIETQASNYMEAVTQVAESIAKLASPSIDKDK